ncbi:MAG: Rho termination factor N-terminal domain-containing protein, partial [Propionibacteriaceae bacterium]|nr:Rho termination factor N-terminal domain-containing protein [Propionibacteriaceae bacterium]
MTEATEATSTAVGSEAETAPETSSARRRKGSGLDAMLLPELKQLAASMGLRGTATMRKSAIIDAIKTAQSGSRPADRADRPAEQPAERAERTPATAEQTTTDRGARAESADRGTREENADRGDQQQTQRAADGSGQDQNNHREGRRTRRERRDESGTDDETRRELGRRLEAELRGGDGAEAKAGQHVHVHFTGW